MVSKSLEHWETKNLGDLVQLINGRGFKSEEWEKEGLPIIRIQNLNGSKEFNYYSGDYDEKILVQDGDLLFSWSGNRGTSFGPYIWNGSEGLLNQHIFKVTLNEKISKKFLYFQLLRITQDIEKQAHGSSGLVHVKKSDLIETNIPLPLMPEQRKIAAILTSVDDAIADTQRIIDQTEVIKRGLMQQLLTKGIGHTAFKQTEIGEIPTEWDVKTLQEVGTWSGGGTPSKSESNYWTSSSDGVLWVSPKDMNNVIITDSQDKITEVGCYEKGLSLLPIGTILIVARSGILRNSVPIALAGRELTINQDLKSLQVNQELNHKYVFYALKTFDEKIRLSCVKSGTTVESIDFPSLKSMQIPIPPRHEQDKIASIADHFYVKQANEQQYLSELLKLKQGLMQVLLTGKVRVNIDESSEVSV